MSYCFINGKILPFKEVKINVNELGLLRSYAVFDYLRTYNGVLFRIKDYLQRFRNSVTALGLTLKYSDRQIEKFIYRMIKEEKGDVGIRLLMTGGYTPDSMTITKPNFIIIVEKLFHYDRNIFTKGVKLISCEFQRFMPRVKTTNYLNAILLQPKKEKEKAFEILYHQGGVISETARNNFFMVKDGKLITPAENILLGITRKVIIEIANKNNIPFLEKPIQLNDLGNADEAFITGSSKGIIPVVKVNDIIIGDGKPGNLTKRLARLFRDFTARVQRKDS